MENETIEAIKKESFRVLTLSDKEVFNCFKENVSKETLNVMLDLMSKDELIKTIKQSRLITLLTNEEINKYKYW